MSHNDSDTDRSRDDRLADVIERYLAASDSGAAPSRRDLIEQYPDLADDLDACLQTLDFIGHSLGNAPATAVLECGQQFSDYQILRELGRGGMGVVYEAFHLGLERRVALKVLSGRGFEDERQRDRFLLEAKTAASLHHTNIVPIFEVGELDGVCYYAMQFIAGQSLGVCLRALERRGSGLPAWDTTIFPPGTIVRDERKEKTAIGADERLIETANPRDSQTSADLRTAQARPIPALSRAASSLPAEGPVSDRYFREAARIVAQAADALAHAHSHNVVHRDVKPSNLILDGDGRVWVADFGLAFRWDDPTHPGHTEAGGTPTYMSPEQVRPGTQPVGPGTDIYSLGATLYEILTLHPIFAGDSSLSVLTQIASRDPVPARQHNPRIPRDLVSIVSKATAKRVELRYHDAAEMAADLRRYLQFEPIRARQVDLVERVLLWCRREPRLAAVTAAAAVLIIAVWAVSQWAVLRARDVAVKSRETAEYQLKLTVDANALATEHLGQSLFQQARATRLSFQNGRRWATLDLIRRAQEITNDDRLRDEAIAALAIPDARMLERLSVDSVVERIAFCPGEDRVAFACGDGSIRVWEFRSDEPATILAAPGHHIESMAFSHCGRYFAAIDAENTIVLWDAETPELVGRIELDEFRPRFLGFLAHETTLVALAEDGTCHRWTIDGSVAAMKSIETTRWQSVVPGPGSDSVTLFLRSGGISIVNLASGESHALDPVPMTAQRPTALAWSPDGSMLAMARPPGAIDLWQPGQSHALKSLSGHRGTVKVVAFSPAGGLLVSAAYRDPTLKLWDLVTGEQIADLREPIASSRAASFSPSGRYLAAGGEDKSIWIWEIESPKWYRRLAAHDDIVNEVAISPNGRYVASGSDDGSILLWSQERGTHEVLAPRSEDRDSRIRTLSCVGLAFSEHSRLIAARLRDNSIRVWDVESRKPVASLQTGRNLWGGAAVQFLPGGNELLRSAGREWQRWIAEPGATPDVAAYAPDFIVDAAATPDGQIGAIRTARNHVEILQLASGDRTGPPIELDSPATAIAIAPDGRLIAVGDRGGVVHLIDSTSHQIVHSWKESDDDLTAVVFSPSGRWLGVTGIDGLVRIRRMPGGEPIASLSGHRGGVRDLAFAPDESMVAICGDDKLIHLFRLNELELELAELNLAW